MSRTTEVNSAVLLSITMWDGNTTRGVRARVFDSAGSAVAGSPFTLTHRAAGHYSGTGWTPTVEGTYSVSYEVYTDGTFATIDPRYEWDSEIVEVRSIDQDLATLLTRVTATRAGNLDNLTAAGIAGFVWDRARSSHNVAASFGESVRLDNSGIADNTISAAKIASAAITSAKFAASAIDANAIAADAITAAKIASGTITSAKFAAGAIDAAAINTAAITAAKFAAGAIDAAAINTGAITSAKFAASAIDATAIASGAITAAKFAANAIDSSALATTAVTEIVDGVWNATLASYVTAGSMGANANLIDDILADTDSLDTTKITAGRASNLDNLDATVSTRATQTSVDTINTKVGTPVSSVSADIAAVKADSGAIKLQTDQLVFASGRVNASIATTQEDAIVDKVWDEAQSGHTTAGTFGKRLDADVTSRQAESDALTRFNTVNTKLGTPAGASISADVAAVKSDTGTINTKIGTPVASVSTDIASVKSDTNTLNTTKLTTTRANNLDNLDATITSRQSASTALTQYNTLITEHDTTQSSIAALNNLSTTQVAGAVWNASLASHVTAGSMGANANLIDDILADTDSLDTTKITTGRANNLDNIDATVSTRATQTSVNGIITTLGTPVATVSADLASVKTDTNSLNATKITTTRANNLDNLNATVSSRATQTSVDTINTKVGTPVSSVSADIAAVKADSGSIKTQTDQLAFTSGRVNASLSTTQEDAIVDKVWDEAQGTHTTPGTFGKRLDADISTLQTEASALSRFNTVNNKIGTPVSTVSADIAAVKTETNSLDSVKLTTGRASNLDNLNATVSSRASQSSLNAVQAEVTAIKAKTDQTTFDTGRIIAKAEVVTDKTDYALSTASRDDLVDKIWDEPLSGHLGSGTSGEALDSAGGVGASPTDIANAVWDMATSSHTTVGSFGASNQGVVSVARANLLDNLADLDVSVSSRATNVQASAIYSAVDDLEGRLTSGRAANLDNLDALVSSRASAASVAALPNAGAVADAVWDEPLAGHLTAGTTGATLNDAATMGAPTPGQIADAVWDEGRAGHVAVGSFGEVIDAKVSTRASQVSLDQVRGAGFNGATDSLEAIRDKIDTLPTSAGDATLANQSTIIASLAGKANQSTLLSVQAGVAAIPTNPLLTGDSRLNNLDATISSRATQVSINDIKGPGFVAGDDLHSIKLAVVASVDLSPVLADLSLIKGAGFSSATDALRPIRVQVDAAKLSADDAATSAASAEAAVATKASQASVNSLSAAVALIPTNPALASDPRFANLDATISSRAAATVLAQVFGPTFNPSTDTLEAIRDAVGAIVPGDAQQSTLVAVQGVVATLATAAGLSSLASAVSAIPLNPLLTTDVRLNRLDANISSRSSDSDMQQVKGTGFASVTDSLAAIRAALNTANLDLSPVLAELEVMQGVGFNDALDALKPANDTAKAERATIKADTQSLLSSGEGF
jgi:hypothetical protein